MGTKIEELKKNKTMKFVIEGSTRYPTIPIIVSLFIVFSIIAPFFLSTGNMQTIMAANSVIMIAAIGQTLVLLTGGIDLSISTVISASAVVSGVVMVSTGSILLGIIVAISIGLFFGLLNGLLVGYFGLTPFITTMGTQLIARGVAFVFSKGIAVKGTPKGVVNFGFADLLGIPMITIVSIILLIISSFLVTKTSWGRRIILLGSSRNAARYTGLKTKQIELSVYLLSGLFAGIAGVVSIANLGNAIPGVGDTILLIIIGGVVLGGTSMSGGEGSIVRTILGVGLLAILTSGLNMIGIPFYDQLIIQGILIFVGNWLSMKFSSASDLAM